MVEGAVYSRLKNDYGVTSIAGTRIFRMFAKQTAAFPYIVITRVDTEHVQSFDGLSGLAFARIQIDCYSATSADQAGSLANAVTNALCVPGGWIVGILYVFGCTLEDTRELPVGPWDGGDTPVFRVMKDYKVGFREEVPV